VHVLNLHAIMCIVNVISIRGRCVSPCAEYVSRFAFRKTLFCIALFSLCSLIVAWKSLDLLLYPLQHINHPAEASRDSRCLPMAGWPPQLLLLTRGLSQHFKHHVRPWLGSASRSSTRSNRSGIGIAGCKPSWTPLPPDQCSKGRAGVHVYEPTQHTETHISPVWR
jgi:hypothetical protein